MKVLMGAGTLWPATVAFSSMRVRLTSVSDMAATSGWGLYSCFRAGSYVTALWSTGARRSASSSDCCTGTSLSSNSGRQ